MKYFTITELTRSATAQRHGIDNTPTPAVLQALTSLVDNILDPLRRAYGRPILVTSGYRSPELNRAVKGAVGSQHMQGRAADITAGSRAENLRLFRLIRELRLPFDQLIFEKGDRSEGPDWVHVSYDPERNRRQTLYLIHNS